ncbi:hypothetical protein BDB01DRAFT_728910 [Pilobolus umbonatus]|nr:hypothetical protein BDB01DRAFT_728910 [Pilobolus umbonatus]
MELDEIKLKIAEEDKETDRISKKLCEVTKDNWKADTHWRSLVAKNQLPSVLEYRDYRTPAALMVAHGSTQLIQLYPLICRFSQYILHLALVGNDISGENLQRVFKEADCPYHRNVRVHDYTELSIHLDEHIGKLMQSIKPRILIQVKPDHEEEKANLLYFALKAMGSTYQMTPIGLPLKDIVHSLWIPDLSLDSLQNWNKIDIKLVVITDRRPHSLSRLLQSSARSIYLGDNVDIMLHMEQSADRATRMLVNSFVWRQGQKMIRHRIRKGGLMPAIVESWYPSHNDEYAVLLEDDIEVSPLFYVWSKYAILKYRYGEDADIHRLMFGISLYAPRNLELIPAGRTTFDPNTVILPAGYPEHIPYVSQVPCSWGAVYFPEHWKEFHTYLVRRLADLNLPKDSRRRLISVPGSRSDKWKKSWKKYFIEMVYLRAYVMLYPNFENFEAFSTNHVEFGTHVKSEKRQSVIGTFMVPLMQRDTLLSQLPDHHLPTFDDLPVLDLWGQLQSHSLLETKASKYHAHVSTCPRTYGTFDPAEFFCPVKGPPDPPQLFPMSSKKGGKEPVLFKNVIQPIRYKYVTEFRKEEEENARNELVDFGPKPLDVAQLPLVEERFSNRDDEMYDLEGDLDTLNRLYYKMKPEDLDFLEDERLDMEEEEEEDDEEEIEEDD